MKFLFVTTISGTVNAFLVPHIKMLIEEGHDVDLAFNVIQPVNQELIELGCNVYDIPFSRSPFKNNFFKLIKHLKSLIKNGKYDYIHTHTPIASSVVRLACRDLKETKIIYTAHGFHFYVGAPKKNWLIFYPIEKYLSKFTDILITINEEDYRLAQGFYAKQVEYVHGVGVNTDVQQISSDEIEKGRALLEIQSKNVFISVGELNSNKNHRIVIEAFSYIKELDFQYFIIGQGPNKAFLENLIIEYELQDKIKLLGYRTDVPNLLQLSDVFIFPSIREGLSKALMEAMSAGLPAIVSDIRGNTDLIDESKGGYVFPPDDSFLLSKQLAMLIDEPSIIKEFSTYNLEKIQTFSMENVLQEMKKIYSSNNN